MLRKIESLALLVLVLFMVACGDDNPVDPDINDEIHAEAWGLVIFTSGQEIIRYENGEVEGQIDVGHGKETSLLSVRFIAEDGELFTPDPAGGWSLAWDIADESVASVEQHEEDGAWNFHIVGLEEGQTTVAFKINHGDHADFVSKEIAIDVVESSSGRDHDEDHDE